MVPEPIRKIYYNSWADENVYNMIREVMPRGFELVALDSDNDAERRLKIADAQVAIVAATPLTGSLIEAASNLQLVHHRVRFDPGRNRGNYRLVDHQGQ